MLFYSGLIDPGIMLKRDPNEIKDSNDKVKEKRTRIRQLGYISSYKLCTTCFIIRPLRSHHCNSCNNCTQRFDHHCPWIGTCVGLRNYSHFYLYLLLINLTQFFNLAICIAHIVLNTKKYLNKNDGNEKMKYIEAFGENIFSLYIIIYVLLTMIFTTQLFFYHTCLILHNMTTKVEIKHLANNPFGNIFERSKSFNFTNILFPNKPKMSLLDIFNYNKTTYIKQQKYIKLKYSNIGDQSKETEENLSSEMSFEISDKNIDSKSELEGKEKEKIKITEKIANKFATQKELEDNENKNEINNDDKNIININEENNIEANDSNIIKNDKNINLNEKNQNDKTNKKTSSEDVTFKTLDYDIQNSKIYTPEGINTDILDNDINVHYKPETQI